MHKNKSVRLLILIFTLTLHSQLTSSASKPQTLPKPTSTAFTLTPQPAKPAPSKYAEIYSPTKMALSPLQSAGKALYNAPGKLFQAVGGQQYFISGESGSLTSAWNSAGTSLAKKTGYQSQTNPSGWTFSEIPQQTKFATQKTAMQLRDALAPLGQKTGIGNLNIIDTVSGTKGKTVASLNIEAEIHKFNKQMNATPIQNRTDAIARKTGELQATEFGTSNPEALQNILSNKLLNTQHHQQAVRWQAAYDVHQNLKNPTNISDGQLARLIDPIKNINPQREPQTYNMLQKILTDPSIKNRYDRVLQEIQNSTASTPEPNVTPTPQKNNSGIQLTSTITSTASNVWHSMQNMFTGAKNSIESIYTTMQNGGKTLSAKSSISTAKPIERAILESALKNSHVQGLQLTPEAQNFIRGNQAGRAVNIRNPFGNTVSSFTAPTATIERITNKQGQIISVTIKPTNQTGPNRIQDIIINDKGTAVNNLVQNGNTLSRTTTKPDGTQKKTGEITVKHEGQPKNNQSALEGTIKPITQQIQKIQSNITPTTTSTKLSQQQFLQKQIQQIQEKYPDAITQQFESTFITRNAQGEAIHVIQPFANGTITETFINPQTGRKIFKNYDAQGNLYATVNSQGQTVYH